ncbi:MAG: formate--tetrahydrofolate ligase [Burkholderiaceae bacterium]|nr:formate--tetrahydrofolate ligase [Burkholderiaceae bacterium]
MKNDLDIAQRASLLPIVPLARDRLGIPEDQLDSYGRYKAKVSLPFLAGLAGRPDGKLVLVSGISPTPAGEGKTTTAVGLADGLNRIGHSAIICLREPSIGPVFGMKGGAAGGGHSQIVPMEDINLHFTGDFHAIALANNLLAALVDNHIHHGNALGIDPRRVSWRRVIDMNDRALRDIVVGLGGPANGHPREDGFDIVAASEVMAILCLATDLQDLKQGLARIVVGQTFDRKPVTAAQLKAQGAMAALLRDAIRPNLVQTLENNPAFVHGGPFANIAHGCSSVIATRAALKLAQVTVTEAGFGADLGAEKFINIKCRKTGLVPDVVVLVATMRALKYHGGADLHQLAYEDLPRLEKGIANLERHLHNLRSHFGLPCVIAVNHFDHDTDAEWAMLRRRLSNQDVPVIRARHFQDGGAGAQELASAVWTLAQSATPALRFSYPDEASLWDKANAVAMQLYGASAVSADAKVHARLQELQDLGFGHLPVCIAKTQYSFSTDPSLRGAPGGHVLNIREVRLSAGAQFVVLVCGDLLTMPGLPKQPSSEAIDVDDDGRIIGLF